jgi:hypothetical protein
VNFNVFSQFGPGGVGNITDNGIWLKADDLTLNNGDPVMNWIDRSGNLNNAQNTNPTEQPIFVTNSPLNGRPALYFNGVLDQLVIPDAPILDGSSGFSFYSVIRPDNLDNAPRGIMGKRISQNANVEYAYTMFFWNGNFLNLDVHTQNNRFNSNLTTFSNNMNYMPGFIFDGSLPAAFRSKIYEAGSLISTSTESSNSLPNSNQDFCIGGLNTDYDNGGQKRLGGHYAEIVQYNFALNSAQRKIVENYLGAKYNLTVANDLYNYEGSYAGEVAGIGRDDETNLHNDSQGSAIVRINSPSSLNDNDYLIWGHNEIPLNLNNLVDIDQVIVESRLDRVWRTTETGDVGTVDVTFDITSFLPSNPNDFVLLIDRNHNGFFDNDVAPQTGVLTGGGNSITFAGVNFVDGDFFTLGSLNYETTPLPIELLSFYATSLEKEVQLDWVTASEQNNDYFNLQRSRDGYIFENIATVAGAGNSSIKNYYYFLDLNPHSGISYYRLIQKDFNGDSTISETISLNRSQTIQNDLTISPNPNQGNFDLQIMSKKEELVNISIWGSLGKRIYETEVKLNGEGVVSIPINERLSAGIYIISMRTSEGIVKKEKLVVH